MQYSRIGGFFSEANDKHNSVHLPELNETLVDQQRHKVAGQIVTFAGQQYDAVKRFGPELQVQLHREWKGGGEGAERDIIPFR